MLFLTSWVLLQQEQAEHQGEQCHSLYDTDDDEVVGSTLTCFAQCVSGAGSSLALEQSARCDGDTGYDADEHGQRGSGRAAFHSRADEVHQQEAVDGLGQGSTGKGDHDKGGRLTVSITFLPCTHSGHGGAAGADCRTD